MITYELAKELNEAGFPKMGGFDIECAVVGGGYWNEYVPTLSELINACGDKFETLVRVHYPKNNIYYQAYPTNDAFEKTQQYKEYPCMVDCCGYESGNTPEEAVAKLWLALNKK